MDNKNDWFTVGNRKCGLVGALIGLVLAFFLLFLGFWRTLFVAALCGIGYYCGSTRNKGDVLKITINKLFPPKGE